MPGLPATYLRVDLHWINLNTGAKALNTLWYLALSGGTAPTITTIAAYANDFKTAFATALAAYQMNTTQVQAVNLKWVSGGNEVEGQNTNGTIDGTTSGDLLPEEDAIVILRRTGLQGRSKRGRIFLPFVSETYQSDGELTSQGVTAAAGVAAMVKNEVTAQTVAYTPHTLDRKNGVLVKVVQSGYLLNTCSRRDRRYPRQTSGRVTV